MSDLRAADLRHGVFLAIGCAFVGGAFLSPGDKQGGEEGGRNPAPSRRGVPRLMGESDQMSIAPAFLFPGPQPSAGLLRL
jgi:hypothetical protein